MVFNYNSRKRKATTSLAGKRAYTRQKYSIYKGVPTRFAVPPKKVELKYADNLNTTTIPLAGSIVFISGIANGSGPSERIGRRIQYHDIQINYHWTPVLGNSQRARAVLVYDKQTNQALPTVTDVMNGSDIAALYNPDNRLRFKILWDTSVLTHQSTGLFYSEGEKGRTNVTIPLKNLDQTFDGPTDAIGDVQRGSMFWVLLGDVDVSMSFVQRTRIQYFDQ